MNIGRRIFFEINSGNVILDTGERSGSVVATTVAQDFESYIALAERVPETVGTIELDFGQYSDDFAQCNGYLVDLGTTELLFSYPDDPTDPEEPPVYQKPLSEQINELRNQINPLNPDEIFLSLNLETSDLVTLKPKKIDQLNYLCNQEILGGFISSCLGEEHTYGFSMEDQANMTGRLTLVAKDPTNLRIQQFPWKTLDSGPLPHTQEEFYNLCLDADEFKNDLIAKYWTLKAQVEAATSKEDVATIVW